MSFTHPDEWTERADAETAHAQTCEYLPMHSAADGLPYHQSCLDGDDYR